MASVEGRVAYLEGRVEDHSQMVNGIRDAMVSLEARMDRRFEGIDRRFEAVDQRLNALDAKMSKQFVWLVGIQVTTLIAVAGGFAAVAGGFASVASGMASLATAIAAR